MEVLVALAVMALIAGLAWQGLDAMVRSREAAQAAAQSTLRTSVALAQWERDLGALLRTGTVPALRFDGAQVRLTREAADGGVQVVVWSRREGAWWRWASPGVTRTGDLQDLWQRSQQLLGRETGTVRLLDGLEDVQVYFHRDNAWTNAQSTGERDQAGEGTSALAQDERLPAAVRLVLSLPAGRLTRDLLTPPEP